MRDVIGDALPLQIVVAAKLYTPEEIAGPVAVVLEGTTIRAIWRGADTASVQQRIREQMPDAVVEVTDLGSWSLAPGYIDLHIHGFHGHDVTTGSQEDIASIACHLPQTGVTSFFPTIATLGKAETVAQVQTIANAAANQGDRGDRGNAHAAEILGMRLEGPFICREKKGAQYEPGIRPPDPQEMEELVAAGQGWIRIVDYAPEEDTHDRFLATTVRLGILACVGHTSATYEQAIRAIDGGARHSTHLFNAMSPLRTSSARRGRRIFDRCSHHSRDYCGWYSSPSCYCETGRRSSWSTQYSTHHRRRSPNRTARRRLRFCRAQSDSVLWGSTPGKRLTRWQRVDA